MRLALVALAIGLTLWARAEGAGLVGGTGCPAGADFEAEGYTIRTARLISPFSFLRWINRAIGDAQRDVEGLKGQPFRYQDVLAKKDELDHLAFLPDAVDQRVRVALVTVSATNCADRQLDLVYTMLTSQVAPVLSGTFESVRAEPAAPERAAGADAVTGRVRLAPGVGYDRAEHLYGGGRLQYRLPGSRADGMPLESMVLEGRGSDTMHDVSAALSGGLDGDGWLARTDWTLGYLDRSEPTGPAHLRQSRLAAQVAMITRPMGEWHLPLRFGGLFEGGRLESDLRGAAVPQDSVGSSSYASAKVYFGTTTRLDRNVLAASYGLELGSTNPGAGLDWIKHVVDLSHAVAIRVGDHRSLTLESRLTGGFIQVPGTVPVTARFFGGGREEPFIPGDAWVIRGNPVIRSLGANALNRTTEGTGGTRFAAYNLTAAIPIWRRPVVPSELSTDREFRTLLDTQITSATSVIQTDYAGKDPHLKLAAAKLGDAATALAALKTAVEAAEKSRPDQLETEFKDCKRQIGTAERRVKSAAAAKDGGGQLGGVAALLSVDPSEDRFRQVRATCIDGLNAKLNDAAIARHGATLEAIRLDMEREFSLIDQTGAERRAVSDMTYVRRTLSTLIDDLNIIAVSPVIMLDAAYIGPADARLGLRYGVGGGLRVTLANSLDVTVGYLANPKRLRGEPAGAFWFAMEFKDLFE